MSKDSELKKKSIVTGEGFAVTNGDFSSYYDADGHQYAHVGVCSHYCYGTKAQAQAVADNLNETSYTGLNVCAVTFKMKSEFVN